MIWSRVEFTGLKMSVINIFKFQVCLRICVLAWLQFVGSYKVETFCVGKERRTVCIFKDGTFLWGKKKVLSTM